MDLEQTQTEEQQQPIDDIEAGGRDDLIAAVREAGGTEAVDVADEAAKAGKEPPTPETESDEPKIAAVLRAREEAHRKRLEAEDFAAHRRAQAEEEANKILQGARERAQRDHEAFLAEQRRRFLDSPTETLRALAPGGDTQKLVDAVIQDGTPEARAIRELRNDLAETKKGTAEAAELKKQIDEMKAEAIREKQEAIAAQVRAEFLSQSATKEKAPYLHARFEEEEIFERANALCIDWQKRGLKLNGGGDDGFTRDDLVDWLERDSKKRYTSVIAPQQVSGAAPGEGAGKRPQGSANGSRTLSAAAGSERRTTAKPLSEMTKEEQRQALIDEVAAVRRTLKDNVP